MSKMGQAFLTMYRAGMITKAGMKKAVADGILSAEEYEIIAGEPYTAG